MKTKTNITRLVLASALGSLIWAGCSTTDNRYTGNNAAGTEVVMVGSSAIAAAPIDALKRRPDTHPEFRTGLWQTSGLTALSVTESSALIPDSPEKAADTTALLPYNPYVINLAVNGQSGTAPASGVITEPAGAQPSVIADTDYPAGEGKAVRIDRSFWSR